jgi:DNA helicase IV
VEHVETFGARSGGKIAEYLTTPEPAAAGADLLNKLAGQEEVKEQKPVVEEVKPAVENKAALNQLSRDAEAEAAAKRNAEIRQAQKDKMADVNDKLSSLLSGNKKDGE